MRIESKALTLAASVLFVALTQSEAGKELITSGHLTINNTDFKLADGVINDHPLFVPPSLDMAREYVEHMGYGMKVERFYSYQQQKGWQLSTGQPIQDWRAAIDVWFSYEKITPDKEKIAKQIWESA